MEVSFLGTLAFDILQSGSVPADRLASSVSKSFRPTGFNQLTPGRANQLSPVV